MWRRPKNKSCDYPVGACLHGGQWNCRKLGLRSERLRGYTLCRTFRLLCFLSLVDIEMHRPDPLRGKPRCPAWQTGAGCQLLHSRLQLQGRLF